MLPVEEIVRAGMRMMIVRVTFSIIKRLVKSTPSWESWALLQALWKYTKSTLEQISHLKWRISHLIHFSRDLTSKRAGESLLLSRRWEMMTLLTWRLYNTLVLSNIISSGPSPCCQNIVPSLLYYFIALVQSQMLPHFFQC